MKFPTLLIAIACLIPGCATTRNSDASASPVVAIRAAPPTGSDEVALTASIRGKLVQSGGCLRIQAVGGANVLPIWRHTVSRVFIGGVPAIKDAASGHVVRVGELLSGSGGAAPEGALTAVAERGRVLACGGPYFLVDAFART